MIWKSVFYCYSKASCLLVKKAKLESKIRKTTQWTRLRSMAGRPCSLCWQSPCLATVHCTANFIWNGIQEAGSFTDFLNAVFAKCVLRFIICVSNYACCNLLARFDHNKNTSCTGKIYLLIPGSQFIYIALENGHRSHVCWLKLTQNTTKEKPFTCTILDLSCHLLRVWNSRLFLLPVKLKQQTVCFLWNTHLFLLKLIFVLKQNQKLSLHNLHSVIKNMSTLSKLWTHSFEWPQRHVAYASEANQSDIL